ncbi:MAG TPA: VOC family protein [Solirubrobacterales bacterium]|nr:VOC family protein [Solirubrobacterales bacterium]
MTLEVSPADIEYSVEFWILLGFRQVEPPPALAETFTWMEREGTQIHLERNESPTVPAHGHVAVVVADFGQALADLREHGFDVTPGREHWGAPRAKALAPGGHLVELMAAPPTTRSTENPATRGSVSVRAD